jgi:hypothetical protein
MDFSGALLAFQVINGINSIGQGFAQSAEDKYNSSLYTNQADALAVQGSIEQGQYTRKAGQLLSTQTADVAAKGLDPTGSAAAVMLSSQTQIETDAAIAKYNNTMAQNQANQKALQLKQQAGQDIYSGFSSAFSDTLKGVADYGAYNNKQSLNLNGGVYAGAGQTSTVI